MWFRRKDGVEWDADLETAKRLALDPNFERFEPGAETISAPVPEAAGHTVVGVDFGQGRDFTAEITVAESVPARELGQKDSDAADQSHKRDIERDTTQPELTRKRARKGSQKNRA